MTANELVHILLGEAIWKIVVISSSQNGFVEFEQELKNQVTRWKFTRGISLCVPPAGHAGSVYIWVQNVNTGLIGHASPASVITVHDSQNHSLLISHSDKSGASSLLTDENARIKCFLWHLNAPEPGTGSKKSVCIMFEDVPMRFLSVT